ncbi:MAG: HEAT repeat domain-containing protein [Candidatus Heimdallarchaeota archaeon]|nr:HEAT repeat domain-containing protein [Candidatus Heimdallarchaeota archaeon]MCK4612726.1 HEAT repeat domain-containing protein [Candidatus Heimdallarchaeota archaeon]
MHFFTKEELIEKIKNKEKGYEEAIIELTKSKDTSTVDFLINELDVSDDFSYRVKIAKILGTTKHPKAIEKLKEVIQNPSTPKQINADCNRWVVQGAIEGIKNAKEVTLSYIINMMKEGETEELMRDFAGIFSFTKDENDVRVVLENFNEFNDVVKIALGFMLQTMQVPINTKLQRERIKLLKEVLTVIENSITESSIPMKIFKGFRSLLIGSLYFQDEELFPYFRKILRREQVLKEIKKQSYIIGEFSRFLKAYKKTEIDLLPEEERQKLLKLEEEVEYVQTVIELNDVKAIGRLLELHESTDHREVRVLISQAIDKILKTHDVETLLLLLDTNNVQTKIGIIYLLGRLRNKKTLKQLTKIYTNGEEDEKVQSKAYWALNQIEPSSADELSTSALTSKKREIRQEATLSILEKLNQLSLKKNKEVTNILVNMGTKGAELVCEAMGSQNVDLRVYVEGIKTIKKIGKDALESLKESLKTNNKDLISFASQAIREISEHTDEETVDLLINILREKNKETGSNAAQALGKIGNNKVVQDIVNIFYDESYDKDQRSEVLIALGNFYDENLIAVYVDGLKNTYERIRRVSAINIGKTGDLSVKKHLINIIENDENQEVRRVALGAIGFIQKEEIFDYLKSIIEGTDRLLQKEAIHAIGKTKDSRTFDFLFNFINDSSIEISLKKNAVLGLRELGDKKAIPLLKELQETSDSQLKDYIIRTIEILEESLCES